MKYNFLGRSGLRVSNLSFGNWLTADDPAKHAEQISIIKRAYELGINYFDTAEVYGYGKGEEALGAALKSMNVPREKLVISTKIFWSMPGAAALTNENGLSRKHVFEGLRAGLQRLGLDYVDIVFCHRFDYDVPLEEICRAMNDVIARGLAFYWGTSEWPAPYIAAAIELCRRCGWHEPVAEQCQYNMIERQKVERDYIPLFTRYGLGTTIWSPLASGLLSGKYNDGQHDNGRLENANYWNRYMAGGKQESVLRMLGELGEFARSLGVSQAQLCIAWTLANSATSTCLLGASRVEQLEENVGALALAAVWKPEYEEAIDKILGNRPDEEISYRVGTTPVLNRRAMLVAARPLA